MELLNSEDNTDEIHKILEEANVDFNTVYQLFQGLFVEDDYKKSEILLNFALKKFHQEELIIKERLSYVFFRMGRLDNALELIDTCLSNDIDLNLQSQLYNTKGLVLWYSGKLNDGINAFNKFRDLATELGLTEKIADANNNLGILYGSLGNYTKAINYFNEALIEYEKLDSTSDIGYIKNNLSVIYRFLGEFKVAMKLAENALEIRRELGSKREQAVTLRNLGDIYAKIGDFSSGETYLNESLDLRKEVGNEIDISDTMFELFKLNLELGNNEKIKFYLNELHNLQKIQTWKKNITNKPEISLIDQRSLIAKILYDQYSKNNPIQLIWKINNLINMVSNFDEKILLYLSLLEIEFHNEPNIKRVLEILSILEDESEKENNHYLRVQTLLTKSNVYFVNKDNELAKQQALAAHNIASKYSMNYMKEICDKQIEKLENIYENKYVNDDVSSEIMVDRVKNYIKNMTLMKY